MLLTGTVVRLASAQGLWVVVKILTDDVVHVTRLGGVSATPRIITTRVLTVIPLTELRKALESDGF